MKEFLKKKGLALAFGAYVLLTATGRYWHEPWRDEADAWLMARDASVSEILSLASPAGTPPLWYFVQLPFAKAGFPYETQGILNLCFIWAAAALILFRSPFPWWVRVGILCSHFFLYEYSALARNYGLGMFLLASLAALDATRHRRPWRYAVVLALLAHVSAHFLFVSAALAASLALEAWPKRYRKARLKPVLLVIASLALCVFLLWPRPGGQFDDKLVPRFNWHGIATAFRDLAEPTHEWRRKETVWPPYVGGLMLFAVALALNWKSRAFRIFLLGLLGLGYVYACKYYSAPRHCGPLFGLAVFALWIGFLEWKKSRRKWPAWRRMPALVSLEAVCLLSGYCAIGMLTLDRDLEYSAAKKAGIFLRDQGLWKRDLVAHRPAQTSAVLPYLPGHKQFYYPALKRWGSHMLWDRAYWDAYWADPDGVMKAIKEQFPKWNDPDEGPVLVLCYEMANPEKQGFRLVYKTDSKVWAYGDEQYWIYVSASTSTERLLATPR